MYDWYSPTISVTHPDTNTPIVALISDTNKQTISPLRYQYLVKFLYSITTCKKPCKWFYSLKSQEKVTFFMSHHHTHYKSEEIDPLVNGPTFIWFSIYYKIWTMFGHNNLICQGWSIWVAVKNYNWLIRIVKVFVGIKKHVTQDAKKCILNQFAGLKQENM